MSDELPPTGPGGEPTNERGAPVPPPAPHGPSPATLFGVLPPVPPPPPRASAGAGFAAGWPTALIQSGLAFLVMAVLGQVAAFAIYLVGDTGGLPLSTFVRIGWFYFGAFHHIGISANVPNLDLSQIAGADVPLGGLSAGASLEYVFGLALLLVTALGVWLLYRAGREVADRAGGGPVARALHGLKVAPVYALPALLFSLLVSIETQLPLGALGTGSLEIKLSPVQAFMLPFLIAAVSGAAGGLRSARRDHREPTYLRVTGALSGGWRMLLVALGLSYLGLFVAGAIQPDDPVAVLTPSTAKYYRTVFDQPDAGFVTLAHHLAIAPNQAMWVLVPAMGSCDGVYGSGFGLGSASFAFLCYDKYPRDLDLPSPEDLAGASTNLDPTALLPTPFFGSVPPAYFLFLLAPAIAVILGGRRAADLGASRTSGEAAALGAAAGLVFAVLLFGVAYLATISLAFSASVFGLNTGGSVRLGPDVVSGAVFALGWGVIGGALGGWWRGRSLASRQPVPAPGGTGFEPPPGSPHPAEGEPPAPPTD